LLNVAVYDGMNIGQLFQKIKSLIYDSLFQCYCDSKIHEILLNISCLCI